MAITTTARGSQSGSKLEQGEFTKVAFAADADIDLFEINVQPPGLDVGDPIETTTMFNSTYRTYVPRKLIGGNTVTMTAGYDPTVYADIVSLLGTQTTVHVHFANGDEVGFAGYLKSFQPTGITFDSFPTADCEIVVTNTASDGTEEAPDATL